jgi:hypothetical protein
LYYYYYPGANFSQAASAPPGSQIYNTLEINALATWKFVTFKVNYALTDYFGGSTVTGFTDSTSGTYYLQLDAAYPLASVEGLSLIGHVGYTHYSAQLSPPGVNNGHTDPSYWDLKLGVSYVWKDGWTVGAYYVGTNNTDFYNPTSSLANTSTKDLGGSAGYITVGRTF